MRIRVPSTSTGESYKYTDVTYKNTLEHLNRLIQAAAATSPPLSITPPRHTMVFRPIKQNTQPTIRPVIQPPTLEQLKDLKKPLSYEWVILEANDVNKNGELTSNAKKTLQDLHLSALEIHALNETSRFMHRMQQECEKFLNNPYIPDAEKKFVQELKKILLSNHETFSKLQQFQEKLSTCAIPKDSWTSGFSNLWGKFLRFFGMLEEQKLQQLQTAELIQNKKYFFPDFKATFNTIVSNKQAATFFVEEFEKALKSKNEPDTAVQKIEIFNAADGKQYNLAELASNKDFVDKNGNLISNKKRDASGPYVSHQQVQKEYQRYQLQKELNAIQASLNSRFGTAFDECTDLEKFKIHALISTIDAKSRNQFPASLPSRLWEAQTLDEHKKILRSQEPSTYSTKVQAYLKENALKIIAKVSGPSAEVKQQSPPSPPQSL